MREKLEQAIAASARAQFAVDVTPELTRPEPQFGDYATNVALQLAGRVGRNPREIAETLAADLRVQESLQEVTVAGPGFLNFKLTDAALLQALDAVHEKPFLGKTVVTEYSDPNPFKVLHAGHFYTSVVGDAISNLFSHAGAQVHRVNFGGDVGLHVGKTMWAILRELGGQFPDKLAEIPEQERSAWLGKCYVEGSQAYEESEKLGKDDLEKVGDFFGLKPGSLQVKLDIIALNKLVYDVVAGDTSFSIGIKTVADAETMVGGEGFAQMYWTCREWSYDYFNAFYARIGSGFERYYPESQTAPVGLVAVKEQLANGVFTESDGAVVFVGEPYGLHTRVFINSEGLPTYEAKDVGLSLKKWEDYHFDKSVIITGNDIVEYMKVVLKAIEQFEPNLAQRTDHITHGNVKLAGGVKMSSRKGNFLRAVDVIEAAETASQSATGQSSEDSVLAAIKYSFLKNRIGADIIFDPTESVSIVGNSGPYLQYAHARARSILAKVEPHEFELSQTALEDDERNLVRKLSEYSESIAKATAELMPHYVCTYLYELAQEFNRFYEKNRVVGDEREALRLDLVTRYADTLKEGLELLGIRAPERM